MRENIIEKLKYIEEKENIKILFAVESGSRAWGFPSKDSDYDVRFIYIHPIEWYLSIEEKRDVIEYPIDNLLDISGWDIKKALGLFKKSNPSFMEWINSPVIYRKQGSFLDRVKDLSSIYFYPKASMNHYLNMATSNYKHYLMGNQVKIKKYFYVLRPILACKWIENEKTIVPMEFEVLLNSQVKDDELYHEIKTLLDMKKLEKEFDTRAKINIINNYIEKELKHYNEYVKSIEDKRELSFSALDQLFMDVLKES
ncbi:putative nucleotidyltransferase [Gottschalkia purinilytica]|uniref:Putative nucleotidyltransferase n=1 Tax=Gottschalkia purinilytica TaxID=1503 RepID=A0A0L0W9Q8_GOTPU|nr:nucleotidyltransferase domain-containing protein [Gottschalkia purinilytica]KNF08288.1 putative nucleotidyltransferase [Gottschalkia purinilytica]